MESESDAGYWFGGYRDIGFSELDIATAFEIRFPNDALLTLLKGPEKVKDFFQSLSYQSHEIKHMNPNYFSKKIIDWPDVNVLNEEICRNSHFFNSEPVFQRYRHFPNKRINLVQRKIDFIFKYKKRERSIFKKSLRDRQIPYPCDDDLVQTRFIKQVDETSIRKVQKTETTEDLAQENSILKTNITKLQTVISGLINLKKENKNLLQENENLKTKLLYSESARRDLCLTLGNKINDMYKDNQDLTETLCRIQTKI